MIETLNGTLTYIWEVIDNSDDGPHSLGFFENEIDANMVLNEDPVRHIKKIKEVLKQDIKGYQSSDKPKVHYYGIEKLKISNMDSIRESALKKLNSLEKKALGL